MVTRSPRARKTAPPTPAVKPFRKERDTYQIKFEEGHPLHGLEIQARPIRQGAFEDLMMAWGRTSDREIGMTQRTAALADLREALGKRLISWNYYDEEANAIAPADAAGLAVLERSEFLEVVGAYVQAASGVPDPLGDGSDDGSSSEVPLVPMDDL